MKRPSDKDLIMFNKLKDEMRLNPPKGYIKQQIVFVFQRAANKYSTREIARLTGISRSTVLYTMKCYGINVKDRIAAIKSSELLKEAARKNSLKSPTREKYVDDETFFNEVKRTKSVAEVAQKFGLNYTTATNRWAKIRKKKEFKLEFECPICNKIFAPKRPFQIYCCQKCYQVKENFSKRVKNQGFNLQNVGDIIKCQYCGKDIEITQPLGPPRKYCNHRCVDRACYYRSQKKV